MKSLKIGISARGLNSHFSGPREYIDGFIKAFAALATHHQVHVYYNSDVFMGRYPHAIERILPKAHILVWDHINLPLALKRDKIDLVIYPKGGIALWNPCRALPIILDMGYFYPKLNAYKLLDTIYQRALLKYSARHAWGIFTISQHTADDVVRLIGVPRLKVQNIYGGVQEHFAPVSDAAVLQHVREHHGLQTPFMFYPTSISPRKNIDRVLDAFEQVQDIIPHHLYFTGKVSWKSPAAEERLNGPLSARVHRLGAVAPEDMPAIYSLADFTIYPSLFEGLGIPLLEAFKCGSPALTSDQSCLPEVAGDAAWITNGYEAASIADGMKRLAQDARLRTELRQKGFERVKKFSWENTAQTALDWINSHWD